MASLSNDKQQSRPSYNWFNSLRRNKQSKSKTTFMNTTLTPEPSQRSCIDLSSSSIFYLKDVNTDLAGTSSTTNICVDEEHMSRRCGTISKLCSPCCGSKQFTASPKDDEKLTSTPLRRNTPTKYETLVEMPDLLHCKSARSTENNHFETERLDRLSKDNVVSLVSKRADFLRTTTVTTTHTVVITRPIEVLVNNKGDIVAKTPYFPFNGKYYLNRRTNSLDYILNEQGMTSDLGGSLAGVRPGVLASCDDLQYIDENNSTSSNNYNNKNFHPYNEKCLIANQVEPTFDPTEIQGKGTKQLQKLQKYNISNNEKNSAVIMNYKKVRFKITLESIQLLL